MLYKRWLIGLLLLMIAIATAAQDRSQPLILLKRNEDFKWIMGDLWEWTGGPTLRQKTNWGFNQELRLSPDGEHIAYYSWARAKVEAIEAYGMTNGGRFEGNIWVINTADDQAYRTANQPADASNHVEGVPDKGLGRSYPIWSPDGTKIAWGEHMYPEEGPYHVVIYDVASGAITPLVTLPNQYQIDTGVDGYWVGDTLIFYLTDAYDVEESGGAVFIGYDATTGEQRFMVTAAEILSTDKPVYFPGDRLMPVTYQGEQWLGFVHATDDTPPQWFVINAQTGEFITLPQPPVALIATNPENSLRVHVDEASNDDDLYYNVTYADGSPVDVGLEENARIMRFALSPAGDALAYQVYMSESDSRPVFVWDDGTLAAVPETDYPAIVQEIVWGAMTWVVEE